MHKDCKECKDWEEHLYCKHLSAKFYRIMTDDFSRRLSLPEEFMNRYGRKISKIVHLKTPYGNVWKVRTRKVKGETYLDSSGWKDFVKDHNIEMNDLLLFEFKETTRSSCFQVTIFGRNGIEKASSYAVDSSYQSSEDPSDDSRSSRSERDHSKESRHHETFNTKPRNFDRNDSTLHHIKQESSENQQMDNRNFMSSMKKSFTAAETKRVHSMIHAVHEGNPQCVLVMRRSYLFPRYHFPAPRTFALAHLPQQSQTVILTIPDCKKKWLVSYLVYRQISCFKGNWRRFAVDNQLRVGDICVLEVMKSHRILRLKVHISRE